MERPLVLTLTLRPRVWGLPPGPDRLVPSSPRRLRRTVQCGPTVLPGLQKHFPSPSPESDFQVRRATHTSASNRLKGRWDGRASGRTSA